VSEQDLLRIKDVCRKRYLLTQVGSLLPWIESRGKLDDAQAARINVHGIGVAFRQVDGRPTRDLCVQVAVLRKMSPQRLARAGGVPVPREIESIPIDVIETGPLVIEPTQESISHPRAAETFRPLRPGCSISFDNVVFGTLGAFCRSTRAADARQVFVLSCRHVLAGFNAPPLLAPIFQPGRRGPQQGAAAAAPVAGEAARFIEAADRNATPLKYSADAAIAPLRAGIGFDPDTLELGPPRGLIDLLALPAAELLGSNYGKFGRTTGLTVGQISTVRRDLLARIGGEDRLFDDQFVVRRLPGASTPMSDPGDSGAMMFHMDSRCAAGLVIGAPIGIDNDEEAVISPLAPILRELEIELA
jgi:endonuclease G